MKISSKGIELIKKFEGCSLVAYKCPAGVWTIGYGHTIGVKQGDKIDNATATKYLIEDLKRFELFVENTVLNSPLLRAQAPTSPNECTSSQSSTPWLCGTIINQNQFDALVSFTFNCGVANLKTLVKNRDVKQISNALLLYNKAKGKVLIGLIKRRKAEKELFDS